MISRNLREPRVIAFTITPQPSKQLLNRSRSVLIAGYIIFGVDHARPLVINATGASEESVGTNLALVRSQESMIHASVVGRGSVPHGAFDLLWQC